MLSSPQERLSVLIDANPIYLQLEPRARECVQNDYGALGEPYERHSALAFVPGSLSACADHDDGLRDDNFVRKYDKGRRDRLCRNIWANTSVFAMGWLEVE